MALGRHTSIFLRDLNDNSAGRAYSIWLVLRELGERVLVVGGGNSLWYPLAASPFANDVWHVDEFKGVVGAKRDHHVIVVKPFLDALRTSTAIFPSPRRLLLDIDDPDFTAPWGLEGLKWWVDARRVGRYQHPTQLYRARRRFTSKNVLVSNPALQGLYGGELLPHVRAPVALESRVHERGSDSERPDLVVAFFGTPRPHKGLEVLRGAVRNLRGSAHGLDVRLLVSDRQPAVVWPGEEWIGCVPFEQMPERLSRCDVVVVPSLRSGYSPYQFPAKLLDAMSLGIPVVASDLPPIRWALGGGGLYTQPGDQSELANQLASLCDPDLRTKLGETGRARWRAEFTPKAVAPRLHNILA